MKPVHWTDLKNILKSPAHYRYYRDNPIVETAAMRIGSHVHQIVLGGWREFVLYEGTRRGKAWDAFEATTEEATPGATIVNRREWDTAHAVAEAVLHDENARRVLDSGHHEVPLEWKIGDRECAGRADVLGDILAELKVTNDASPDKFPWHARRMGWLGQLMWYSNGAAAPVTVPSVSIIAVESKPPHVVTVYDLTLAAIEEGDKTWRSAWERLMLCEENNHWPGYVEGIAVLDVPDPTTTIIMDGEEIEV